MPETLLEAEFFGVAPGAYTGADRKGRDGKFKLADGGTLFLDEIGDMPLALQSKLLRVLQEQEVEPLGSNTRASASTCASSPPPAATCRRWSPPARFRADLYYRLNVLPIRLPALRERLGRPGSAGRGAGRRHRAAQRPAAQEPDAPTRWSCWRGSAWPGNIRELRNVLEQASLMTDDLLLDGGAFRSAGEHGAALPRRRVAPRLAACAGRRPRPSAAARRHAVRPLPQAVAELEGRAIREALRATGGNKLAASRLLGISRATLYEKLALAQRDGAA